MKRWSVYGVVVGSERAFESPLPVAPPDAPIDVVYEVTAAPVPARAGDDGSTLAGIRVPGVVDFRICADRIVAHVPAGTDEPDGMAEIHFLSSAMTTWLEYRGILALHASAVVIEGGAVAFMATSRGGKSGLAAALVAAGHPLLTDDILALHVESGGAGGDASVVAEAGYPQMRMWPDGAEAFVGEAWRRLPLVHADYRKTRVPIGTGLFGRFHPGAARLRAIVLPERVDEPDGGVESGGAVEPGGAVESGGAVEAVRAAFDFARLGPTGALLELTKNTFSPRAVEDPALQPRRLARLAALVERVPVYAFRFPSGYSRLPEAAAAIVDRL